MTILMFALTVFLSTEWYDELNNNHFCQYDDGTVITVPYTASCPGSLEK